MAFTSADRARQADRAQDLTTIWDLAIKRATEEANSESGQWDYDDGSTVVDRDRHDSGYEAEVRITLSHVPCGSHPSLMLADAAEAFQRLAKSLLSQAEALGYINPRKYPSSIDRCCRCHGPANLDVGELTVCDACFGEVR